MTWDRMLGIAGVVLGLPGFLLLFFTEHAAIAALALIAAFLFLVFALFYRWSMNRPPFSMKSVEVTLTIADAAGAQAKMSKRYGICPNFSHLSTMTHRNIASDGSITNLCWNKQPLPKMAVGQALGEYTVTIHFPGPLEKGKVFEGELSYDIANSFPCKQEALVYVVDFQSPKVTLKVRLPAARPSTSVTAYQVRGAGKVPLNDKVQLKDQGTEIELTLKRPPIGAEYEIWWVW